jgi:hypothetical protein
MAADLFNWPFVNLHQIEELHLQSVILVLN